MSRLALLRSFWHEQSKAEKLRLFMLLLVTLFAVVTPWLRLPSVPHPLTSYFFIFIWLTTILVGLAIYGGWRGWFMLPKSPLFIWAGIWCAAKVVSSFVSIVPLHSIWGGYGIWADGLIYLASLFLFLGVMATLRPTQREIVFFVHILLLQVVLLSLNNMVIWLTGVLRPLSVFLNSDFFFSYALLLFPVAVVLLITSIRQRRGLHPWQKPLLYGVQAVIIAIGLFVSLPVDLQNKVFYVPSATEGDFLASPANAERFYQWELGIAIAKTYPWFGSGPGSTQAAFYDLHYDRPIKNWDYDVYMAHPHNDLIEQWSQTGIVGLGAYVLLLGSLCVVIWKGRHKIEKSIRPYALGLCIGLVLYFLFNQFLFVLPYTGVLSGLWIIALLVMTEQVTAFNNVRYARLARLSVVLAFCVLIAASYWAFRYTRGEQLAIQAVRASRSGNLGQAAVLAARATASYPYDELYAWRASNETSALINSGQATLTPQLLQTAIHFAEKAVVLNSYVPLYRLQQGSTTYVLNPPGSAQESAGLVLMDEALAQTPKDFTLHLRAARAFRQKGDTVRMQRAITAARAVVPDNKKQRVEAEIAQFASP